jgi:hypothetical protein
MGYTEQESEPYRTTAKIKELEAKLKIATEALERILDTYKNGTWTANLVSRKALEKLKAGDGK